MFSCYDKRQPRGVSLSKPLVSGLAVNFLRWVMFGCLDVVGGDRGEVPYWQGEEGYIMTHVEITLSS